MKDLQIIQIDISVTEEHESIDGHALGEVLNDWFYGITEEDKDEES